MEPYIDLRPYITLRRSISDEKGHFLSIPTISLYDFLTDTNDKMNLVIEAYLTAGHSNIIFFELTCIVGSMVFLKDGKTSNEILLTSETSIPVGDSDKPAKIALFVKLDVVASVIEFYDAYYCTDAPIPQEFIDDSSHEWVPFILGSIRGNKFSDNITTIPQTNNQFFTLETDPLTSVITHCYTTNDCMSSQRIGYRLDNTNDASEYIKSADILLNTACISKNSNGTPIISGIPNNNMMHISIMNIKNNISNLRKLQKKYFSTEAKNNAILHASDFESYKQSLLSKKTEYNDLLKKIQLDQYAITRKRKDHHNIILRQHDNTCTWMYYSALCLLIKDENMFIEEWLSSWDKLGIEHFYIYDNGSKNPIKNTVASISDGKYLDKCTFIDFSSGYNHMQYDCYEHCLCNYGKECYWIGFVDTDEMLEFTDSSITNVNKFLSGFERDFALWIPWECYNANNHINKPAGLQKDVYTKTIINPLGLYGKCFIQPYRTRKMYVHAAIGIDMFDRVVTQNYSHLDDSIHIVASQYYSDNRGCFTKAKINHYITRSFEDWVNKMNRGSCDPNFRRKFDVFFDYNPDLLYLKNDPKVQELLRSQQGYIHG